MEAGNEFIGQLLTALFVLGLLVAVVRMLRGGENRTGAIRSKTPGAVVRNWLKMAPHQAGAIEIIERKALTPQHSLHRFRISEREFLVATHPQGCVLIAEMDGRKNQSSGSANNAASTAPAGGAS